jgi:hypothetical protein
VEWISGRENRSTWRKPSLVISCREESKWWLNILIIHCTSVTVNRQLQELLIWFVIDNQSDCRKDFSTPGKARFRVPTVRCEHNSTERYKVKRLTHR